MRFGPYHGGHLALYYTSSNNGGVMQQVVCAVSVHSNTHIPANSQPATPTQATTDPIISVIRPEEDSGSQGVLFPWQSGDDRPQGNNNSAAV